jgi:hypothetical protein
VEDDVAANPGDVRVLGTEAAVAKTECRADPIEQAGPGRRGAASRRPEREAGRFPPESATYGTDEPIGTPLDGSDHGAD